MLLRAVALALVLAPAVFSQSSSTEPSASPAAKPPPPRAETSPATPAASPDDLFELGRSLFDQYAPAEVKEQYEFPSKEQWDAFAAKLQGALNGDSYAELAAFEPQARSALAALRVFPGYEDYATWLEERLDYITAAKQLAQPAPPRPPDAPSILPARRDLPQFELWVQRLRETPLPANAERLLPSLVAQFVAEGTPEALVWLAEVESSFNPQARSPAGARGLFQLMPVTAKALGLSTALPDERTDPKKSAAAAARLLKRLYSRFGDWPLALAAYNAGEGRVSRAMTARKAKTFAEVAPALSVETRLYVPKVYATIAHRAGIAPETLSPPQ